MRDALRTALPGTLKRIGMWFSSLFFAVGLFSVAMVRGASIEAVIVIFRITIIFALPVSLLCLPMVFLLKNADNGRARILLLIGFLIGPACLALWGLTLQLRGDPPHLVWQGEGEDVGVVAGMICASIVGFLTTALYVTALKVANRQST
jgi:hypothetical protein